MVDTKTKLNVLKKYFGYDSFRDGQERIIDDILNGNDVLAVMPTGAGKSLCFQIPALMMNGTAIVISPLISLMKDQIYALKENGIPAEAINSSLDPITKREIYSNAYSGKYKLLYISPERLDSESFLSLAAGIDISVICIDEAHCVSQWGQDFRSSYLKIADFIASLDKRPVVAAFTATATEIVRKDIVRLLELRSPDTVVTGFDRKNLYFEVRTPKDKLSFVKSYIESNRDKSGIIYCSTRKTVEQLHSELILGGYSVTKYHAGLETEERKHNQEAFVRDDIRVMIATNAFGMGIDKSNVSFVIHYNLPSDIESYYQEAGRAGRDGERAECILLYSGRDIFVQRYFINNPTDNAELTDAEIETIRKRKRAKLEKMINYGLAKSCLRATILSYFGESHSHECGNCSVCCGVREYTDITIEAQKILSAVVRTGESLKTDKLIDLLLGNENAANDPYLSKIKTFGAMRGGSESGISDMIICLTENGFAEIQSGVIKINALSKEILFSGRRVHMPFVITETEKRKTKPITASNSEPLEADEDLFRILKKLRKELADRKNVPAFVIFADSVLREISAVKPRNNEEFMKIKGVGVKKAESYGQVFTKAVNLYINEENLTKTAAKREEFS